MLAPHGTTCNYSPSNGSLACWLLHLGETTGYIAQVVQLAVRCTSCHVVALHLLPRHAHPLSAFALLVCAVTAGAEGAGQALQAACTGCRAAG
jgi:hypothetical protein